jgi:hypothetical protein
VKLDHSSFGLRESEHSFWLWVLLTFLWVAANSSLVIESVASGALISAALAYMFTQKTNVWQGIRFSPSRLARDRGLRIAAKRGRKRAVVAVARKLAVIMHRMWLDGGEFRFAASDGREDSAGASQTTALAAPC